MLHGVAQRVCRMGRVSGWCSSIDRPNSTCEPKHLFLACLPCDCVLRWAANYVVLEWRCEMQSRHRHTTASQTTLQRAHRCGHWNNTFWCATLPAILNISVATRPVKSTMYTWYCRHRYIFANMLNAANQCDGPECLVYVCLPACSRHPAATCLHLLSCYAQQRRTRLPKPTLCSSSNSAGRVISLARQPHHRAPPFLSSTLISVLKHVLTGTVRKELL